MAARLGNVLFWASILRRFLILTACSLFASGADAADYGTMGQGAQTCASFNSFYRVAPDNEEQVFFDWAQGFMSGLNTVLRPVKNLASISIEEQQRSIHKYCNDHPSDMYSLAVNALYGQLQNSATYNVGREVAKPSILMVTWFYYGQPPATSQAQFTSMEALHDERKINLVEKNS